MTVAVHALPRIAPANIEAATAWTEGRLVFDHTPLAEAVAQFNRYNTRQLVIDDPDLPDLHVSGTFSTSDTTQLVNFLQQRLGLTAQVSRTQIRLSRP